jgi:hypothetical protein
MSLIFGRVIFGRVITWKPYAGFVWLMFMGLYFFALQVFLVEVLDFYTNVPMMLAAICDVGSGYFLFQHWKEKGLFKIRDIDTEGDD